jgi:hypothetical protein
VLVKALFFKNSMFRLKIIITLILTFLAALGVFYSCKNYKGDKPGPEAVKKGEKLAEQYCQSCHVLPDPALLDAGTWTEGVLPVMGPYLGVFAHHNRKYPSGKTDVYLDTGFYPSKPLLKPDEWQSIIDYYTAAAPDSLKQHEHNMAIRQGLPGFRLQPHSFKVSFPTSSYVKIDTGSTFRRVLLADLFTRTIYRFDSSLNLLDSVPVNSSVVDIEFNNNKMMLCDIGEINPNNKRLGSGKLLAISTKGKLKADTNTLLTDLARPVQISSADFNKDGFTDYLVCEFGFMKGSLSLFTGNRNNTFEKQVLRGLPGAAKAYIQDYNGDGLPDIWVLFAQGEEGVFLFTNKGNKQFEERQVLRFPSVYGSTFFELVDFNKDGHQDIVYTCGDNADYSQVLKPYHGIYIFLNDGKNNFRQQYFYHMNGCYKALVRDYDNDGDLDIAAISFFADYTNRPDEGFLYLVNEGNYSFQPYTLPEGRSGRWLTMDAGDLNGDGKIDLVLGNFSYGPVLTQPSVDWTRGASFIFLRNTAK